MLSDGNGVKLSKWNEIVYNWKPTRDVMYSRYGPGLAAAAVSINAIYIANYFRTYLRLLHYARFAMYGSALYFPSLIAGATQSFSIQAYTITRGDSCEICVGLKGGFYQAVCATLYPLLLVTWTGMFYAHKYNTYVIPPMQMISKQGTIEAAKLVLKIMKFRRGHFVNVLTIVTALNAFAGYWFAVKQREETYEIFKKILDEEEDKLRTMSTEERSKPIYQTQTF